MNAGERQWEASGAHPSNVLEAVDKAADAAANQLVRKALKFISLEDAVPLQSPSPLRPQNRAGTGSLSPLFKFDSGFFDKGLDAITGVGKLVEGFAVSLDNVIGQAFEEWGTGTPQRASSKAGKRSPEKRQPAPLERTPTRATPSSVTSPKTPQDAWGDFDIAAEDRVSEIDVPLTFKCARVPERASTGSTTTQAVAPGTRRKAATAEEVQQWRRRAQVLQRELQKLRAQKEEYEKEKVEQHNSVAAADRLTEEISRLQLSAMPSPGSSDPIASEQVMRQMEALVAEKAALAQENDRLLREKASLLELLEFTMLQQAADVAEDDLFCEEGEVDVDALVGWEPGCEEDEE